MQQVTITIDDTIILHGGGDKKVIEERCEQVSFLFIDFIFEVLDFYLYVIYFLNILIIQMNNFCMYLFSAFLIDFNEHNY